MKITTQTAKSKPQLSDRELEDALDRDAQRDDRADKDHAYAFEEAAATSTARLKSSRPGNSGTVCSFCGREKIAYDFCCPICWRRLPNSIRALFIRAANNARIWLRANPEQQ